MPRSKRQKVRELHDIALECWEHYRNYLDSLDQEDGPGDIDELQEILELLPDDDEDSIRSTKSTLSHRLEYKTIVDLLPMLVSVIYYHLGESAIAESLMHENDDDDDRKPEKEANHKNIQSLLIKSLQAFPTNAATWSMGANYGRMTQRLSLSNATEWYRRAANDALVMREVGLKYLTMDSDNEVDDLFKEWIELLLLNQITGVEFEPNETEEKEEDEEGEKDPDADRDKNKDEEDDESESDGHYSASTVESTARFMCAMLESMQGNHESSAACLERFGLTHRLHPNVWKVVPSPHQANATPDKIPTQPPLMFCPTDGILPEPLYQSMKQVFAPQAAYWKESNYVGRGYYSYFVEYEPNQAPKNLIEEVIVNHLLPRAKQVLPKEEGDRICGFEWWTHTRPIQANLGHNLHFDTDEALLAQEKEITHPILSSVLYLTGGGSSLETCSPGGATIILDQTPESPTEADQCWQGIPVNNALLLFPGNLLHGVLPCPGMVSPTNDAAVVVEERNLQTPASAYWNDFKSPVSTSKSPAENRLTFMVGFWTRNVPLKMKERHLYGPCGPLPPATEDHSWVMEIQQGYDPETTGATSTITPTPQSCQQSVPTMTPQALPRVSPAWERLPSPSEPTKDDPFLQVPHSIDHRFFVKGPNHCFLDSLFEDHPQDGTATPCE